MIHSGTSIATVRVFHHVQALDQTTKAPPTPDFIEEYGGGRPHCSEDSSVTLMPFIQISRRVDRHSSPSSQATKPYRVSTPLGHHEHGSSNKRTGKAKWPSSGSSIVRGGGSRNDLFNNSNTSQNVALGVGDGQSLRSGGDSGSAGSGGAGTAVIAGVGAARNDGGGELADVGGTRNRDSNGLSSSRVRAGIGGALEAASKENIVHV